MRNKAEKVVHYRRAQHRTYRIISPMMYTVVEGGKAQLHKRADHTRM